MHVSVSPGARGRCVPLGKMPGQKTLLRMFHPPSRSVSILPRWIDAALLSVYEMLNTFASRRKPPPDETVITCGEWQSACRMPYSARTPALSDLARHALRARPRAAVSRVEELEEGDGGIVWRDAVDRKGLRKVGGRPARPELRLKGRDRHTLSILDASG